MTFIQPSRASLLGGLILSLSAIQTSVAQLVTITAQDRFIQASTSSVSEDGTPSSNGPVRDEAPAGDFSTWTDAITLPGNITAQGNQTGGWDGSSVFDLSAFGVTLGGGGGPGSSGNSTITNRFSYTFQVNQSATYTLNGLIGSQLPMVLSFHLTGPGVAINDDTSAGDVTYTNATGSLVPGSYTLTIEAGGTVSYVGPGGNGAGGGATPFTIVIAPATNTCTADFNNSGSLTVQDIFDFLSAWFSGDARADFNGSGGITVQDIFDFLSAWFVGCP
jgi:hypothetical protein